MRNLNVLFWSVVVPAMLAACYSPASSSTSLGAHVNGDGGQGADGNGQGASGQGGNGQGGTGQGGQGGVGQGGSGGGTCAAVLPDAIAQVLQSRCASCHGPVPAGGAPIALASFADLTAQSAQYPGQTYAERSLVRMQANTMPPGGGASASDEQAFSDWIAQGMPPAPCPVGAGGSGGGAGAGGGGPSPNDPLNAASTCSSGASWDGYSTGSRMAPGESCIQCHTQQGGPYMSVGGTLYPTGHEPNDCNGASGSTGGPFVGAAVVITDCNGNQLVKMTPNSAGNFRSTNSLPATWCAEVDYQGKVRKMASPPPGLANAAGVDAGDCNACHTATGANGAPGRVTLPM